MADDLMTVKRDIKAMLYIMQDLLEDYFDKYDSENKQDEEGILWEFERTKARVDAINFLMLDAKKTIDGIAAEI